MKHLFKYVILLLFNIVYAYIIYKNFSNPFNFIGIYFCGFGCMGLNFFVEDVLDDVLFNKQGE